MQHFVFQVRLVAIGFTFMAIGHIVTGWKHHDETDLQRKCQDALPYCDAISNPAVCCGVKPIANASCAKACKYCYDLPSVPGIGGIPGIAVPGTPEPPTVQTDPCNPSSPGLSPGGSGGIGSGVVPVTTPSFGK